MSDNERFDDEGDGQLAEWRRNRGPEWYRDIGYAIEDGLRGHIYQSWIRPETKPTDPGWHACTCGWEGYWSGWHGHVANHLRGILKLRSGEGVL